MKLYYYPTHAKFAHEIPLYTEDVVADFSDVDRADLQELDKEAIARIGDKPCYFAQRRSLQEAKQSVERLRLLYQEFRPS